MAKRSDPTNSVAVVNIGNESMKNWHTVCLSFQDGAGAPVTTLATGTAIGYARRQGSDKYETFSDSLNLAYDERTWMPFNDLIDSVKVELSNLPANVFGVVQVNNWEDGS